MIIMRRGVNRSASTPPNRTNTASGPIQAASAKPTEDAGRPAPSSPAVRATGIMPSPKSATVRATKK